MAFLRTPPPRNQAEKCKQSRHEKKGRVNFRLPVEAELEGVGAGGVGAEPQGVEEAGRVAEAGGAAAEVDARAEGAPAVPGEGRCRGESEGGRRVRGDCETVRVRV